eukprot:TRINITY_DN5893_c0_g1_i1.p1 TRINITY_DN5893_c0_g1~~TRINITY_DN5893_c0_g1_i1.p1  ORF type:complete len:177 (+),score=39.87 TRINITY_DN5893_c0_g1_i1:124-654(+)
MEPASEITNPRIYVACLAAYNNGILHGAWIDASQEAWAIYDGIRAMLDISPITDAEEWAIHDYEGFEGIELAEYAGIEGVAEKAAFIAEHGRLGAELFTYYGSLAEARQALEDRYRGQYECVTDFMQETTEGSMAHLRRGQPTGPLVLTYRPISGPQIGRAVQQECRDRSRMPSSA